YVLRGEATVTLGDETHRVKAGDALFIPRGVIHSYQNMGEEPFEFLCVVPNREDKITVVDEGC
ncbi:MAG: cupin domain-containing protein, partial [Anaerolineales bacterium]|nr:cupin domain-containing protein [Anaerolineales bacterium]